MDLQQLSQQIDELEAEPPFHLWNPPNCGDIDMRIKADGSWWYMGSPIGRIKLVKLFAKVLLLEDDKFYLKTPAEKVGIQVDDAPFVITDWKLIDTDDGKAIEVTSNLDHKAILSPKHPLEVVIDPEGNPKPYVTLHRRLKAAVHRNVYYQWIEIADEKRVNGQDHLMLSSGSHDFSLGQF